MKTYLEQEKQVVGAVRGQEGTHREEIREIAKIQAMLRNLGSTQFELENLA